MRIKMLELGIDYKILDNIIEKIVENPKYIIMNSNTLYKMWKDMTPTESWNKKGVSYTIYHGIPVAICEKLEDGEIEIV